MLFYDSYLILLVNPCHGRPRHKVANGFRYAVGTKGSQLV